MYARQFGLGWVVVCALGLVPGNEGPIEERLGASPSPLADGVGSTFATGRSDPARPLTFEPNAGQVDPGVRYLARSHDAWFLVSPAEIVIAIPPAAGESNVRHDTAAWRNGRSNLEPPPGSKRRARPTLVRMTVLGANPDAAVIGAEPQPGFVNYLRGNDPSRWHARIPTFGRVRHEDIYAGIDLVLYGRGGAHSSTTSSSGPARARRSSRWPSTVSTRCA